MNMSEFLQARDQQHRQNKAMIFTATVTIRNARQPSTRKKVFGMDSIINIGACLADWRSCNDCPVQALPTETTSLLVTH